MPIIRESPHAKVSPDKNAAQWPPRSPFQALLSSPSGRKKWRDRHNNSSRADERSVSPSPVKNASRAAMEAIAGEGEDDEDEEDEETLSTLR